LIRFNHIFTVLLLLAILGAFVVPSAPLETPRALVGGLFYPVAKPARAIAEWSHRRAMGNHVPDDATVGTGEKARPSAQIRQENEALRVTVASLSSQLDALKQLNADRQLIGPVLPLCTPVPVTGADAGTRQSLMLETFGSGDIRVGQPVLYSGGIAGRIARAAVGTAQVRLITDRNFRVSGRFGRFVKDAAGNVSFKIIPTAQPPLLEGMGDGAMRIRNVDRKDITAAHLAPGDWVVLADPEWSDVLQGYKLGQIRDITARPDNPLFAQIELQPVAYLLQLREVMFLNKEGAPRPAAPGEDSPREVHEMPREAPSGPAEDPGS
jgi:cell shape-determining protein MreC